MSKTRIGRIIGFDYWYARQEAQGEFVEVERIPNSRENYHLVVGPFNDDLFEKILSVPFKDGRSLGFYKAHNYKDCWIPAGDIVFEYSTNQEATCLLQKE